MAFGRLGVKACESENSTSNPVPCGGITQPDASNSRFDWRETIFSVISAKVLSLAITSNATFALNCNDWHGLGLLSSFLSLPK
jgi:hypothetical protein